MYEYQELRRIRSDEEAEAWSRDAGWSSYLDFQMETGHSLDGSWVDADETSDPPDRARRSSIHPIAAVVHGRVYPGRLSGLKSGNKAWVRSEDFERLF